MSSNETNELLVKLLAAAEGLPDPYREYIVHVVTQLSAAAIKERAAAAVEMQTIRRRLLTAKTELLKSTNSETSVDVTADAGYACPDRRKKLHAVPVESSFGRLSPPYFGAEDNFPASDTGRDRMRAVSQLQRGAAGRRKRNEDNVAKENANMKMCAALHGQRPLPLQSSSPLPFLARRANTMVQAATASKAQIPAISGFEHFSQERMRMLQTAAPPADSCGELSGRPAVEKKVTAANAEPLGPRRQVQRGRVVTARQQADDFFAELDQELAIPASPSPLSILADMSGVPAQEMPARVEHPHPHKRAASEGSLPGASVKKIKAEDGSAMMPPSTRVVPILRSIPEHQSLTRPTSAPTAASLASMTCPSAQFNTSPTTATHVAPLRTFGDSDATSLTVASPFGRPTSSAVPASGFVPSRVFGQPSQPTYQQTNMMPGLDSVAPAHLSQYASHPSQFAVPLATLPVSDRIQPPKPSTSHGRPKPKCIKCIAEGNSCSATAHCKGCSSDRCVYIRCKDARCRDLECRLLHKGQYDAKNRPHGTPRWHVLGDNLRLSALSFETRQQFNAAQRRLTADADSRLGYH